VSLGESLFQGVRGLVIVGDNRYSATDGLAPEAGGDHGIDEGFSRMRHSAMADRDQEYMVRTDSSSLVKAR